MSLGTLSISPTMFESIVEDAISVAGWFKEDSATVRINAGSEESIAWFLAQGWYIESSAAVDDYVTNYDTDNKSAGRTYVGKNVTYELRRKKLQGDRVLQNMVDQFVVAYNEGRRINNQRYEDVLTIQANLLQSSQDSISTVEGVVGVLEGSVENLLTLIPADFSTYDSSMTGIYNDYGASVENEVNDRFDGMLADARNSLISKGMYNTTVWASVQSGIERDRQKALTDLADKVTDKKFSVIDRVYQAKTDMRSRFEQISMSLVQQKSTRIMNQLELRNAIIRSVTSFIESRTDDYPGMSELSKLAVGIGYADGSGTVR